MKITNLFYRIDLSQRLGHALQGSAMFDILTTPILTGPEMLNPMDTFLIHVSVKSKLRCLIEFDPSITNMRSMRMYD